MGAPHESQEVGLPPDHVRRGGEQLQVLRAELLRPVGRGEALVGVNPGLACVGLAPAFERGGGIHQRDYRRGRLEPHVGHHRGEQRRQVAEREEVEPQRIAALGLAHQAP
jgi:hypothetical protein